MNHCTPYKFFKFSEFLVSAEHPDIAAQMKLEQFERERIIYWCQACGDAWRLVHQDNPLIITSGKRIPRLNDAIGGSQDSDHLYCCAVDLHPRGMTAREFFCSILDQQLPYRQLILYKSFVHWSINIPGRPVKHQTIMKEDA